MSARPAPLDYARPTTPPAYGWTALERVLPQLAALLLLGGLLVIAHAVRALAAIVSSLFILTSRRRASRSNEHQDGGSWRGA